MEGTKDMHCGKTVASRRRRHDRKEWDWDRGIRMRDLALAEYCDDRLIEWLTDWLIDWLADWVTNWLTVWLIGSSAEEFETLAAVVHMLDEKLAN